MRRTLLLCLILAFFPGWHGFAKDRNAADNPVAPSVREIPAISRRQKPVELYTLEASMAVSEGLRFLKASQNPDGSFGDTFRVAETALTGLTLLAAGNSQGRGPYAKEVRQCVDYLLQRQNASGYYTDDGYSRMHGHGFALLFLAEAYGMNSLSPHEQAGEDAGYQNRLKESLQKAVDLAVASQTELGGWNYDPGGRNAFDEASITVCVVQGLRAARDAGIAVPRLIIDAAVGYIEKSYDQNGSFLYSLRQNIRRPSFALTAAGVSTLVAAGEINPKHKDIVEGCLRFMEDYRPGEDGSSHEYYYYYAHFYSVQAMMQVGGQSWQDWYIALREDLLKRRRTNAGGAYWESSVDTVFATAMATLILQAPNGYLPIFQK